MDDSTKRQLRFSLFLQSFATLLFGTVTVVRAATFGIDALTTVFGVGFLLASGALIMTVRYMRSH
jgi:hypothetical protein